MLDGCLSVSLLAAVALTRKNAACNALEKLYI